MLNVATLFVPTKSLDDNFLTVPNPNKTSRVSYQKCLACNLQFAGANVARKSHVAGVDINGTRVKSCLRPNAELVMEIKAEISKNKLAKVVEGQREALLGYKGDIAKLLVENAKPVIDQAILKFITVNDLAPNIVDSPSFKDLIKSAAQAGINYAPPNRHKLSIKEVTDVSDSPLGSILSDGLNNSRIQRIAVLQQIKFIGGTLCSDGAKNRKRSCLNSTCILLR